MTTHSPYIINYLSLSIQSFYLKSEIEKLEDSDKKKTLIEKLNNIIPIASSINTDNVDIYEINDSGSIHKLDMPYGIPSDKNYLNQQLRSGNIIFDNLLEIEEEL